MPTGQDADISESGNPKIVPTATNTIGPVGANTHPDDPLGPTRQSHLQQNI